MDIYYQLIKIALIIAVIITAGFLIRFLAVLSKTAKTAKATAVRIDHLQSSLQTMKTKKEYIVHYFDTKLTLVFKAAAVLRLLRFFANKDNRHLKGSYAQNKDNIRRIIN